MPSARPPARAPRADTVRETRRRGAARLPRQPRAREAPTAAVSNSLDPEGGMEGDASLCTAGNPAIGAEAAAPLGIPAAGSCQVSGPAAPTRAALPGYESPGPASPPAARTRSRGALSWRGPEIPTGFPPCARTEDLSLLQPCPWGYGLCGARGGKREAWMRSLAHPYPTAHLNGQHYSQLLLHPHGRQVSLPPHIPPSTSLQSTLYPLQFSFSPLPSHTHLLHILVQILHILVENVSL